jgi:predicted Zn-ribbon and HTH transcriptional regulator
VYDEFCENCGYQKPYEEMNYRLCPDCREEIESDEDWWR